MTIANVSPARESVVGLPDVQASEPALALALDEAGISDLRYPIRVRVSDGTQETVANVSLAASLAASARGVHMSRFVDTLQEWRQDIGVGTIAAFLEEVRRRLDADAAVARFAFPLFLERRAPATEAIGLVPYECVLAGRSEGEYVTATIDVSMPVTSLCPCSREISDYGAHNQRGAVEIGVEFDPISGDQPPDFERLADVATESASAPMYSMLKRPDERHVTMQAYDNPAFVEDIARSVAVALRADPSIRAARVRVVNEESIHTHNAYAAVAWAR